jgi:iron complex transport system substrate-binding protein
MRRRALLASAGAALLGAACRTELDGATGAASSASSSSAPQAAEAEAKLVVAGGPLTEIVFALGAGGRVVAVDTSSTFPAEVQKLPKVGYQRQLAAEGILSLSPGMLIASEEAGPPAVLAQLRQVGVRIVTVPGPKDPVGIARRVREVGEALGRSGEAEKIAASLSSEIDALLAKASSRTSRPRALFLYARGQGTLMVGGKGTSADVVLGLAGLTNAAESVRGFEPLSAEAVVGARPDLFIVPEKGLASLGGLDGLFALPGMAQTPAAASRRAIAVDDLLLLGLGPRTTSAVAQITREVYGA